MVRAMNPDTIIIAVGAIPLTPPIKGIENKNVFQAIDTYKDLNEVGKRVVVIGGGYIGCEISLELAMLGHNVEIIEITDTLASNGNRLYKEALREKMSMYENLHWNLETTCNEIDDKGVTVSYKDGKKDHIEADTVILSTGFRANRSLVESFCGITYETYIIGDCERARKVDYAINEGYFIGRNI